MQYQVQAAHSSPSSIRLRGNTAILICDLRGALEGYDAVRCDLAELVEVRVPVPLFHDSTPTALCHRGTGTSNGPKADRHRSSIFP